MYIYCYLLPANRHRRMRRYDNTHFLIWYHFFTIREEEEEDKIEMASDSARLAKVRASIPISRPMHLHIIILLLQDEILVLIHKRVIYRFVPPHNFDQFFIHDCFELRYDIFQEYPGSRGMVTSRNILERVPLKWLKAIYGKRRT